MEASQTFKDKRSRLTKEQRERVTPELVEEIYNRQNQMRRNSEPDATFRGLS